ncbi:probable LRR receptor-like serine/threonine-protein kinase At1g29720 isoform X2 [Raphanus sativus]|uniref:non-specific serine/threonine protein kinase n=1 Tax=Raphanus sativus TaxID=3726 RepID=A0A9W3BR21_RAPSA|nr:probable LRR receptor-like serine/threonine-protein kinase At1g29720 isoform X2 [Raphanus sativus]
MSMMWIVFSALLFFTIITRFSVIQTASTSPALHPDELNSLEKVATTLGIKRVNLSYEDPCSLGTLMITQQVDSVWNPEVNNTIACDCSFNNKTICHITELVLMNFTLEGKLPPQLAKLRYLQSIDLSANYLTGTIPVEWASMSHLVLISLSGNRLSGKLPTWLQNLKNLKFLGVEGNQFSGPIPHELGNLTNLERLYLSSNQFTGSLPITLAKLVNLRRFWICDNNLSGTIPAYIGNWSRLERLYLYASGLKGPIPDAVASLESLSDLRISDMTGINSFPILSSKVLQTLILRNVSLSGPIPPYIWNLPNLKRLDLSFNKLTGEVQQIHKAPRFTYLAGNMLTGNVESAFFVNSKPNIDLSYNNFSWSSTCHENSNINTYRSSNSKNNLTGLFPCAGPITCKSYHRSLHINCGGENVQVTNSSRKITYQADNKKVWAATNLHMERWGISNTGDFTDDKSDDDTFIVSTSLRLSGAEKIKHHINYPLVLGATGAFVTSTLLAFGIYAWRRRREDKITRERDLRSQSLQTVCYTWRQLKAATNNFDQANKLGEGGFGAVFKGELWDGTIIAVKQLSSKSHQGNREFVNEIGMISGLNHPNLVKLYGCCVEKNQLLLVYEYMENNSLALALHEKRSLKLDWVARRKICVGIAKGLEFLHEGSTIRMVHRDIKTSNVLLDADLNAKISDFGLARLHEEERSHISTKVAGTMGYMAPEYVLWGQLTEKVDVYSFGVVAMEIVSGQSNTKHRGSDDQVSLINWALTLQQKGDILEIVDPLLEGDFNSKEAMRMINVALVCTNSSPSLRPTMSEAVQMLEGVIEIKEVMPDPGLYGHDWSMSKLMHIDTRGRSSTSGLTDRTETTMKSSVSGFNPYQYPSSSLECP